MHDRRQATFEQVRAGKANPATSTALQLIIRTTTGLFQTLSMRA